MVTPKFLGFSLLIVVGLAMRQRKTQAYAAKVSSGGGFPFHLPSCDPAALTPEFLETATAVRPSDSGNMGGVFFMGFQNGDESDCMVVAKPLVDLHDLFANTLAEELGAPVVKANAVRATSPLYKALLTGIANAAQSMWEEAKETENEKEKFVKQFREYVEKGDGYFQIMEKAPGRDSADALKGLEFKACQVCVLPALQTEIDKLEAQYLEDAAQKVNDYVTKLEANEIGPFQRKVFKLAGVDLEANEQEAEIAANVLKLKTWMNENPTVKGNPLGVIYSVKEKDIRKAKSDYECEGRNAASEWPEEKTMSNKLELQEAFRSTTKNLADLTIFLTLVGENDNVPQFGLPVHRSNMHNMMLEKGKARGIDIAVGGATTHKAIRKDGSCEGFENFTPLLNEFITHQWVRQGSCKTSEKTLVGRNVTERTYMEEEWSDVMRMPYYSNEYHGGPFYDCFFEHGGLFSKEEADSIAASIAENMPASIKSYLDRFDQAVAMTAARLSGFGGEEIQDIVGWLLHRSAALKKQFEEADEACSAPSEPIIGETTGSSMDGSEPPLPPSFPKKAENMGYAWHTVETMWKKSPGKWFGTRTTNVVAVPLKKSSPVATV